MFIPALSLITLFVIRPYYSTFIHCTNFDFLLSLPRESTLVATGLVSTRFLQILDVMEGKDWKVKVCLELRLPTECSREWNL